MKKILFLAFFIGNCAVQTDSDGSRLCIESGSSAATCQTPRESGTEMLVQMLAREQQIKIAIKKQQQRNGETRYE